MKPFADRRATVCGPVGVGKTHRLTRLAAEHGVQRWEALEWRDRSASSAPAQLIIDHVDALSADDLDDFRAWCEAQEHASILFGSRWSVGVTNEVLIRMDPLDVRGSVDDENAAMAMIMGSIPSGQRAELDQRRAVLVDIADALGGLPLLLLGVAPALHLLGPEALLGTLKKGVDVRTLITPPREYRLPSYAAALDLSLARLSPEEREVAARFAQIPGPVDIHVACDAVGTQPSGILALDSAGLVLRARGGAEMRPVPGIAIQANETVHTAILRRLAEHYFGKRLRADSTSNLYQVYSQQRAAVGAALAYALQGSEEVLQEAVAFLCAAPMPPIPLPSKEYDSLLRAALTRTTDPITERRIRGLLAFLSFMNGDSEEVRRLLDRPLPPATWDDAPDEASSRARIEARLAMIAGSRYASLRIAQNALARSPRGQFWKEHVESTLLLADIHRSTFIDPERTIDAVQSVNHVGTAGPYRGRLLYFLARAQVDLAHYDVADTLFKDAEGLSIRGDGYLRAHVLLGRALLSAARDSKLDTDLLMRAREESRRLASRSVLLSTFYLEAMSGTGVPSEVLGRGLAEAPRGVGAAVVASMWALLARQQFLAGDKEQGGQSLGRAIEISLSIHDLPTRLIVQLCAALHGRGGNPDRVRELTELLRTGVTYRADGQPHTASIVDRSVNLRLAMPWFLPDGIGQVAPADMVDLVVSGDAASLRCGGEQHAVSQPRVARLLSILVRERILNPGQFISAASLFEEGWLGEVSTPPAIKNSVRVAISELRRYALRETVESSPLGGYRLRPDRSIAVIA